MVLDVLPDNHLRTALFDTVKRDVETKVSKVMDLINIKYGKGTVLIGSQGNDKRLKLRAEKLCPCYTTRIGDIIKIKVGASELDFKFYVFCST